MLAACAAACKQDNKAEPAPRADEPPAETTPTQPEPDEPEPPVDYEPKAIATGIPECDNVVELVIGCERMPQKLRNEWNKRAKEWKSSLAIASDANRANTLELCKTLTPKIEQARVTAGCD